MPNARVEIGSSFALAIYIGGSQSVVRVRLGYAKDQLVCAKDQLVCAKDQLVFAKDQLVCTKDQLGVRELKVDNGRHKKT
ncbi:hypothetical protein AVEN_9615-1 [Araneus ventricosus]|uniref:Uncharacterized protein n=1 Tax=Araneus ventricosus TaxID=182803 RepID=A0A4Y2EXQ2_ARAVE|nr:hypothetical protein AVEN_9615-1 [Araneus ventricosus]